MNWQALCDDPLLTDLPFKFETNRWGKIEMNPVTNKSGFFKGSSLNGY